MAALANLLLYSNFLRGSEPWLIKFAEFREQPYLDVACPSCGHQHANVCISERIFPFGRTRGNSVGNCTHFSGAGAGTGTGAGAGAGGSFA